MILVIDASVAVKWYLAEDYTEEAENIVNGNFELHAPDLIFTELGNVLWKKHRAGNIDAAQSLLIAENFRTQNITTHPLKGLLVPALKGANSHGQSVYDWTYVALAISLACKFVTADRRFFLSMRSTSFKNHMMWIEELIK